MTFKDSLDFLFKSIDCEVPNTFVFNKDGSIKVPSLPNHLLRYTDDANCLYKIKYYCDIITSIRGNGFLDNGLLKHHKNDYKNLLGAIYYKLSNKDLFDKHGYLNDKNFPYLNCPKDYNDMERIEFIILLHIVMIIDPKNSIIEEIESKKDCLKYFFNQGYPVLNNNFNETKVKLSKILFNYYNTKQTQTSHEKTLGSFIGDKINDSFLHKYFQTILNITEADLISKKDIILKKIIDAYKELNHSFEKSRTFLGFECVLTDLSNSIKVFYDKPNFNNLTLVIEEYLNREGLLKSHQNMIHDQSKLPEPVDNFVGLPLPPLPPNANKVNRTRVLPKTTDYGSSEFKIDSSVSTIDNTLFNRETITSKNDRPYGKGLLKSHQNMIQDRSNLSAREYNDVRYQLPQLPPNANIGESRRSFSETTDYAYSVNTNDDGLSNDGTSTSENALRNTPHNSSATHSKSVSSFDLDRFLKDHEECFNSEQFLKLNLKVVNSLNDKCDSELYTRFAKIVVDNNVNFRSLKFISKDDNFNNYFIEAFVSQNLDQDAYKRLLEYVCLSCSADKNALFEKIIDDIDDNNTFSEVILGSENIKTRFVNFLVESDIEDAKSDYLRISSNKKPRFDRYLKKTNTELYNLLQSEKVVSNKQDNQNLIHNDSVSDLDFVAGDRQNLNYIKEPEKISNESAVFATTASTVVVGSALAMASAAALFTAGASIITAVCVIAAIKKYNIDQEVKYDNLPDKSTHFSANESIRVK
ncbi:MAG: hypothetical protein ISQ32_05620 [Rickettsiales bacterium]|nr:hypothetical protein [Rickettsiales bacterium]